MNVVKLVSALYPMAYSMCLPRVREMFEEGVHEQDEQPWGQCTPLRNSCVKADARVKLPTACFRRTTQRVQQRDRRQQDQGVCRIVLMHFHCKQSWPQANPGRRPCAALLAPTLAPLLWGFYMHPILGAKLPLPISEILCQSSDNPLCLWCSSAQLHLFSRH